MCSSGRSNIKLPVSSTRGYCLTRVVRQIQVQSLFLSQFVSILAETFKNQCSYWHQPASQYSPCTSASMEETSRIGPAVLRLGKLPNIGNTHITELWANKESHYGNGRFFTYYQHRPDCWTKTDQIVCVGVLSQNEWFGHFRYLPSQSQLQFASQVVRFSGSFRQVERSDYMHTEAEWWLQVLSASCAVGNYSWSPLRIEPKYVSRF